MYIELDRHSFCSHEAHRLVERQKIYKTYTNKIWSWGGCYDLLFQIPCQDGRIILQLLGVPPGHSPQLNPLGTSLTEESCLMSPSQGSPHPMPFDPLSTLDNYEGPSQLLSSPDAQTPRLHLPLPVRELLTCEATKVPSPSTFRKQDIRKQKKTTGGGWPQHSG